MKQHALIGKYPEFFEAGNAGHGLSDGGFSTGPGWDGLLSTLFLKFRRLGLPPEFRIVQVKEKFGTLRCYHNGTTGQHDHEVEHAIREAEATSSVTCEQCGMIASLTQDHGWWRTLCASCQQRRAEV